MPIKKWVNILKQKGEKKMDFDGFVSGITGAEEQYKIEPKNMEKRVEVFINQLLPDMLLSIDSIEEGWFQIQVLHRHCDRFCPKLNEEQSEKVDEAVCEWIEKWEVKMKEKRLPRILPKKTPIPDTSKMLGRFQDRRL